MVIVRFCGYCAHFSDGGIGMGARGGVILCERGRTGRAVGVEEVVGESSNGTQREAKQRNCILQVFN